MSKEQSKRKKSLNYEIQFHQRVLREELWERDEKRTRESEWVRDRERQTDTGTKRATHTHTLT